MKLRRELGKRSQVKKKEDGPLETKSKKTSTPDKNTVATRRAEGKRGEVASELEGKRTYPTRGRTKKKTKSIRKKMNFGLNNGSELGPRERREKEVKSGGRAIREEAKRGPLNEKKERKGGGDNRRRTRERRRAKKEGGTRLKLRRGPVDVAPTCLDRNSKTWVSFANRRSTPADRKREKHRHQSP